MVVTLVNHNMKMKVLRVAKNLKGKDEWNMSSSDEMKRE